MCLPFAIMGARVVTGVMPLELLGPYACILICYVFSLNVFLYIPVHIVLEIYVCVFILIVLLLSFYVLSFAAKITLFVKNSNLFLLFSKIKNHF